MKVPIISKRPLMVSVKVESVQCTHVVIQWPCMRCDPIIQDSLTGKKQTSCSVGSLYYDDAAPQLSSHSEDS